MTQTIITVDQMRKAMQEKGLSQATVARMSKVSQSIISTWLSGKAEPSDISKTRIGLALDIIKSGEVDDQQINAAITQEPEETKEVPALERIEEAEDVPARETDAETGDDYSLMSDEDAAAEEIVDALGMRTQEDEPPAEDADAPGKALAGFEPYDLRQRKRKAAKPESAPGRDIADAVFALMQFPDVIADAEKMTIDIRTGCTFELMDFVRDLNSLKLMLVRDAISRYAFDTACESLLESYKEKAAKEKA